PNHRELIRIVVLDGLSYEEAAKALGVSIGTVRSRLSRARTELRNHEATRRMPVWRADGRRPPEPAPRIQESVSKREHAMAVEPLANGGPGMAPEPITPPAAAPRVAAAVSPASGVPVVRCVSSRPVAPGAGRPAGERVVGRRRPVSLPLLPGTDAGRRPPGDMPPRRRTPVEPRLTGLPWNRDGPRPCAASPSAHVSPACSSRASRRSGRRVS
ncbi:MAG TPA: RNA polymerase sigma factor, partial [Azospirillum sp.]|nr:RNA polymerase sigma factor [Azospirillum sp.]